MNEMKINKCGCGHNPEITCENDCGYEIQCPYCGVDMAYYNTEADAIVAWNTAHPDIMDKFQGFEDALKERERQINKLKEQNDELQSALSHWKEKAELCQTK